MLELLFTALHVALSAVALTLIVRNAPVVRRWVFELRKPWACNVCMPLYTCAAVVGGLYWLNRDLHVLLAYLPAYALTFSALDTMAKPPGAPHIPPEMFMADEDAKTPSFSRSKMPETPPPLGKTR